MAGEGGAGQGRGGRLTEQQCSRGRKRRCSEVRAPSGHSPATHHLLGQLVHQQLVLLALLLHLLGLLVIVDGQLLQSLKNFLHLILGGIILGLQVAQLPLDLLIVSPSRHQQLGRGRARETSLRLLGP